MDFETGKQEDKLEVVSLIRTSKYSNNIQERLFEKINKIKKINLSEMTQLNSESFEPILKKAESLESLNLSGCTNINGKIIPSIATSIQTLELSHTNITDIDIRQNFSRFKLLSSLDLSFCSFLSSKFVAFLNLNVLESLSFSDCPKITPTVVNHFSKGIIFFFFKN